MNQVLTLYRVGWCAFPFNQEMYTVRHPPVASILKYWHTGSGSYDLNQWYDTYVGLVAVPEGVDPMTVVQQDFPGAWSREMTKLYDPLGNSSDRFSFSDGDWDTQRLAYLLGTGQLYTAPIVGHYECGPVGDSWWCTTNIEFFDL